MPRNRAMATFDPRPDWLMRLHSGLTRASSDELEVKPQNQLPRRTVRERPRSRPRPAAQLPQGLVRSAGYRRVQGATNRSATAGRLHRVRMRPGQVDRAAPLPSAGAPAGAASSSCLSWDRPSRRLAHSRMSAASSRRASRQEWHPETIRPDRAIVADGPARSANALVRRTLEIMGAPKVRAPAPAARARESHSANAHRGKGWSCVIVSRSSWGRMSWSTGAPRGC